MIHEPLARIVKIYTVIRQFYLAMWGDIIITLINYIVIVFLRAMPAAGTLFA